LFKTAPIPFSPPPAPLCIVVPTFRVLYGRPSNDVRDFIHYSRSLQSSQLSFPICNKLFFSDVVFPWSPPFGNGLLTTLQFSPPHSLIARVFLPALERSEGQFFFSGLFEFFSNPMLFLSRLIWPLSPQTYAMEDIIYLDVCLNKGIVPPGQFRRVLRDSFLCFVSPCFFFG